MIEKIKNRRLKLVESEVIDTAEIELTDLLTASSKAEKAILDLCDKCLAFKNSKVKEMSLQLKSRAAALTQALSNLEVTGDVSDVGGDELGGDDEGEVTDSSNLNSRGDKQRLDQLESSSVFESVKAKYFKRKKKKLKEFSGLEMEADEPGIDHDAEDELTKEKKVIKDNTYEKPAITEESDEAEMGGDKVIIDLTEPFEQVIKGLDPSEFHTFKSGVISKLEQAIDSVEQKKDSAIADEFTKSIEALSVTQSVDDFDMGMEQIYDFADTHDILVETVTSKKKK